MPTDRFLNVVGGTIFARRWDPTATASNTPLVLLHDSLGSVELWREFPGSLAEKLRRPVVAYDRLGFGRSSARTELPSADFIHEEAERYLPAVLRELAIAEFVLFGHSVGGAMALVAAARGNESCQAVITESAQAFVEDCTVPGGACSQVVLGDRSAGASTRRHDTQISLRHPPYPGKSTL